MNTDTMTHLKMRFGCTRKTGLNAISISSGKGQERICTLRADADQGIIGDVEKEVIGISNKCPSSMEL